MNERIYQKELIQRIEQRFPQCVVLKTDPRHIQGIPDLIILFEDRWAMLEVKMSDTSPMRPNQEYYVNLFMSMSLAYFINPDNEEDVLNDIQSAFGLAGQARIS